jgi:hypothetical protein
MPRCGQESLTRSILRRKYSCGSCGLAFGISGTDQKAIDRGRRGVLARHPMSGKLWLRLVRRISVRTGRDLP